MDPVGQGQGKTLSSVRHIRKVLKEYRKTIFITNVQIKDVKNKTYFFKTTAELMKILKDKIVESWEYGYLIFIDEIQVVFGDQFYKGVTTDILEYLSQQRKSGIYMIGTTQLYSRLPKTFREYLQQSGQIIICHKIPKTIIQFNHICDMSKTYEIEMKLITEGGSKEIYIPDIELYESYNTFARISMITSNITPTAPALSLADADTEKGE